MPADAPDPDPQRPDDAVDRVRETQRDLDAADGAPPRDTTERTAGGVPPLRTEDVVETMRRHDARSEQDPHDR